MSAHASQPIISVADVHKSFGKVQALAGISLQIEKGKVLGLLGPNGAGKTTLVRVLTTLITPDAGHAQIAGYDIVKQPMEVRSHIGLAGQYAAVDENLTGRENLEMVGRLYHRSKQESRDKSQQLLEQFSLTDAADRKAKTYSGGMRRRLDLAASLVGDPEVLFLDEPTTGLDPRSRLELWTMIENLVSGGTTVLLTTQYLEEADYLADTIVMIDKGKVIAHGTASELKSQIGGGVVEVHIAPTHTVADAQKALATVVHDPTSIQTEEITHALIIPAESGAKTLISVVQALSTAGIEIADIELRKPSLDEVFLALTHKDAR